MSDRDLNVKVEVEGTRDAARGIGALALAGIPVVLVMALAGGIAAVGGFYATSHEIHQISRQEDAEKRADNRVGAAELPKQAIKLSLKGGSCIKFDSGYLEGSTLIAYIENTCHLDLSYYQLRINGCAPDGTVVQSDYENTSQLPLLQAGEKAEVRVSFDRSLDDRIVAVKAYISRDHGA